MRFTIRTEDGDDHELYSPNELEWAVDRLNSEPGSFLCLEPESPLNGLTYIQAAYIRETKGFFKKKIVASYYQVEVQEEKPNGDLLQYFLNTEDLQEVLGIFHVFFESQAAPDLSNWRSELFYRNENR